MRHDRADSIRRIGFRGLDGTKAEAVRHDKAARRGLCTSRANGLCTNHAAATVHIYINKIEGGTRFGVAALSFFGTKVYALAKDQSHKT